MPFSNDKGNRESEKYCSKCFTNGELCYKGNNLKEFQRIAYNGMLADGMNPIKAKFFTWCISFAPRWKSTN
ncbi:hypothetical protein KC980_03315 [candidate division WWE3 bacterium]|uniref:Putative zinc ribbon domain-containing protein n=1 Tax=candidate division WWE3 bacterium TaxID=2053526 RepID=A0A955EDD4_UNCKA|nr:hypothetical protein [candidate division WWE3 bacterium]